MKLIKLNVNQHRSLMLDEQFVFDSREHNSQKIVADWLSQWNFHSSCGFTGMAT